MSDCNHDCGSCKDSGCDKRSFIETPKSTTKIKKIIGIMVRDLQKRCKEQLQIDLVVREAAKESIVEKAYDRKYGARPLRRKLQDEVEDRLADALIRGEIHAKDRVIVTTKNKEIIVSKDKK